MKQMIKLGLCAAVLMGMTGCMKMRTDTKAPVLEADSVPKLYMKQSLVVRNAAKDVDQEEIGDWIGWTVYGDLHDYTDSAVEATIDILKKQGIKIGDGGKVLDLCVTDALSEQGAWKFRATVTMTVKTGSGLSKKYIGEKGHGNGYSTSSAMEMAMGQCVMKMLNDEEIIAYLQN
ncbi:MAG: hypothetical protein U9P12_09695 [Verrucomicrobiota bacterium]|nr:hypothetical protein [Verrucomicrobiota bacterium]